MTILQGKLSCGDEKNAKTAQNSRTTVNFVLFFGYPRDLYGFSGMRPYALARQCRIAC